MNTKKDLQVKISELKEKTVKLITENEKLNDINNLIDNPEIISFNNLHITNNEIEIDILKKEIKKTENELNLIVYENKSFLADITVKNPHHNGKVTN